MPLLSRHCNVYVNLSSIQLSFSIVILLHGNSSAQSLNMSPLLQDPLSLAPISESVGTYSSHVSSIIHRLRENNAVAWIRSTSASTPIEEIKRRYWEHAYLYVKEILPREEGLRCARTPGHPKHWIITLHSGRLVRGEEAHSFMLIFCLSPFLIPFC